MNFQDDIKMQENIMNNVEKRLKKHITYKKARKVTLTILPMVLAAFIAVLNLGTIKSFASKIFINDISQGINLAIGNNKGIKINKSFNVAGIKVDFKEMVADETGIALSYKISNPDYYLGNAEILNKDGKSLLKQGNNASFSSSGINNIKNLQPEVDYPETNIFVFPGISPNSVIVKFSSLVNRKNLETKAVNIGLPLKITKQQVKNIKINKTVITDTGSLVLQNLKCGVMFSELSYKFTPNKARKVASVYPDIHLKYNDKELEVYENYGCDNPQKQMGYIKFAPAIYNNTKKLEIDVLALIRSEQVNKEYSFKKAELPKKFDLMGSWFTVKSMEIVDGYDPLKYKNLPEDLQKYMSKATKVVIEFNTKNRVFSTLPEPIFSAKNNPRCLGKNVICGAGYSYKEVPINVLIQNQEGIRQIAKNCSGFSEYIRERYSKGLGILTSKIEGPHDELTFKVNNVSIPEILGSKVEIGIK